jgi:hypothetical protein
MNDAMPNRSRSRQLRPFDSGKQRPNGFVRAGKLRVPIFEELFMGVSYP